MATTPPETPIEQPPQPSQPAEPTVPPPEAPELPDDVDIPSPTPDGQ